MRLFSLIAVFILSVACQKENTITIGYQGMANPWKHLIKIQAFDELTDKKIEWKKFDSGSKVISAMASGDVDLSVIGSTPLAIALGQGLPLQVVWIMGVIGESEALIAKPDFKELSDLKGKKVAVPFGSTSHYHLMLALQKNNIAPTEVEIFNLTPSGIVSSWKNDQIDAAYVWAPALEEIKGSGNTLVSSLQMAKDGDPTFDALVGRKEFLDKNKDFTAKFLDKINGLHQDMNESKWNENSKQVQNIADFLGAKPKDVLSSLAGYKFPTKEEQLSSRLLGGGVATALEKTSLFLKDQDKISEVKDDFSPFINLEPAKALK